MPLFSSTPTLFFLSHTRNLLSQVLLPEVSRDAEALSLKEA